jgi:hypothetical protein
MKKLIVTSLATTAVAVGAFAQGSLSQIQNMFSSDGITTQGVNASDPNTATTWFTGNVSITLYSAASSAVSSGQASTINTLDATSGVSALAQAITDGYVAVSSSTADATVAGPVTGFVISDGGITAASPNAINLLAPVPSNGSGWLGMLVTEVGGATPGAEGFITWSQASLGANPFVAPVGPSAVVDVDPAGVNLVLTTSVPEPGTIALACLGGASLLMFRRKKVI